MKVSALDELKPGALPAIHWTQTSISRQPLSVTPAHAFTEYAQAQVIEYCVVDIGRDNGTHPLHDFDKQLVTRDPNERLREEVIATRMKWDLFRQIRRGDVFDADKGAVYWKGKVVSTLHRHSEHATRFKVSGGPFMMNLGVTLTYSGLTYIDIILPCDSLWSTTPMYHYIQPVFHFTVCSLMSISRYCQGCQHHKSTMRKRRRAM